MKGWQQFAFPRRRPDEASVAAAGNGHGPALRLRPVGEQPATLPQRRRLLQPLPLLGVALVLVALVGYWSVYGATTKRAPVLIAVRALPAGAILQRSDLRVGELAGDRTVLASIVAERELSQVLGRRLAQPLPAGVPLARAAIATHAASAAAFTLALPVLHALAGALQPGDRVSVLATFVAANGGARTRVVARGLRVLAVGQTSGTLDAASATIPVTLALPDPSLASSLALANEAGKLDLLREGGRGRTAPIPPAREPGS